MEESVERRTLKSGPMVTVEEAAQQLSLSSATLRAWILRRKIEYVRLGRAVRIPQIVIDRLLERGRVPARATEVA
jgi:excisionase family DNA binding protein